MENLTANLHLLWPEVLVGALALVVLVADFFLPAERKNALAMVAVVGLTSLGLPGLSGFVAELLVFIGTFRTYPLLGVLGVIGAAITAVYILRLLAKVFFGPLPDRWQRLPDASRLEAAVAGAMVAVLVLVGVYPTYFIQVINSGVLPFVKHVTGV